MIKDINMNICNQGSAWGIIGSGWIVKIISLVLLLLMAYIWYNTKGKIMRVGLSLVLIGGIANLFERLYYGCVSDYWKPLSWWPAFNGADVLVTVGICIAIIAMIFIKRRQ